MKRPCLPLKITAWLGVSAAAATVAGLTPVSATEVVSETHATILATLAGASSPDPGKVAYLSAPVVHGVYAGGQISSVSGSRLADVLATWTDDQFNGSSGRFSLQLTSGAAAGWSADITATMSAVKAIDLARPVPANVVAGDKYRIRKLITVDDVFSDANASWPQAAGNPSEADNVILFNNGTKSSAILFRSAIPGYAGWFDATYQPSGDRALSPGSGWIYRRRTSAPATLVWIGVARDELLLTTIKPGLNLVGTALATASPPLAHLGLYTGNTATGLRAGNTLATADSVIAVAPDGSKFKYFYSNAEGNLGWRDEIGAVADAVSFPAGSAFFVDRNSNEPSFEWLLRP